MLVQLSIRDLVLIERVALDFGPGLSVLTGETGAGKSILLDGLNLALGERADAGLVRKGTPQASVTAEFHVPQDHPALALLAEHDIPLDEPGQITLRRTLKADGGSRAHVNDTAVSAGLLRQLGGLLVEIHGQHDERGLLNPRGHMALLDAYAAHPDLLAEVAGAHAGWKAAGSARAAAEARMEADARDRDWLEHASAELKALKPQPGEEAELSETRAAMQKGAKLADSLDQIDGLVSGGEGALSQLRQAARRLERIAADDHELQAALEAVDRALVEGDQLESSLASVRSRFLVSPDALEAAEARLFELRAMARKHRVEVEALPTLAEELAARLTALENAGHGLQQLQAAESRALATFEDAARRLSAARAAAAKRLDSAVAAELPALKLESARFRTRLTPTPPGETGADQVQFEVATNAGSDFGPLIRIASGGELSRFTLALKVALASAGAAGTLIFDEIDRGVGGATANAIGNRLARVAEGAQVLVVTHSPQVAATGAHHFRILKAGGSTSVVPLAKAERTDEIARMLSGAEVTAEARAQAERLLGA
ncbi:DNA repair protein RecN [Sandaracinobacter sp. RS1-74]|uniref:DNA repair protein RecN n=1 Tax=Sandaracinobacteroides sayramensis TaxID=2913411 RepID=UPI001EDC8C6E|nr:DNA repair protein RecN [Sandaracinobacteroides sayramensis]MCG2841665.1 DNA repair protein RecN [Sandaracinobacteroides sayramensis]